MNEFLVCSEKELEGRLGSLVSGIRPADRGAMEAAERRWSKVAKPLKSLGVLEEDITQIAGITGSAEISLDRRALLIFCADHGVVDEGVSQTGREVTAVVTANFTRGDSCACLMAREARARVFPVDIGVAGPIGASGEIYPLLERRIRNGTANLAQGPAMTRREALAAVLTGISLAGQLKREGYQIIATGEMGIGNTTCSSAVASVLLRVPPEQVTGRGAGLSGEGLRKKIRAVERGIAVNQPDPEDGIDVLHKVGGLDLAGLAGTFLGGAIHHIPVVIDGVISAAAAAAALAICRPAGDYLLASHVSAEPAGELLLRYLGKKPAIQAGLCLGEGTGAVAFLPLLSMALTIYREMSTFSEMRIEEYRPL